MQAVFLGMLYTSVFKLTLLRSFGSYNGMLRTTPINKKKKRCFCLISTQLPIFGWIQFSESVSQPSSGCCERKISGVLQKTTFYVHAFQRIAVTIHFPHCRILQRKRGRGEGRGESWFAGVVWSTGSRREQSDSVLAAREAFPLNT